MCDEYCVYAKDILALVDTIELKRCASIKCLLKYCTKLEYLILDDIQPKELISQKYPAIKQLGWTSDNLPPQLKEFMVNNPNITAFFASNQNPIETTDWLLETGRFKVKLNDLVLKICNFKNAEYLNALQMNVPGIIKNVMSLHKNQQIKTLHLEIKYLDFLLHPKLPEIEFLESAHVYIEDAHRKSIESISRGMRNLKFLFYYNKYRAKKSEYQMLAQNLTELEEFHTISVGSIDVVMPFIRYSPKLRVMFLETSELYPTAKNVSLELLHKERHKLENACKLTIYVDEPTYLNSPINSCGLVEIKRTASYPLSKHPIRPLKS
ncbi:uncharacterized protein LOC116350362 [Contarinia nasturtii]|uniref:uncharacterized protein LOC116350362 n=1 Tax=Contarinia nasturtii TaxID=265458 RepID=UPI0012D46D2A|nr:uncharacterized protein LOC116350362 [Contarinia nasturtii]XP_031637997.1 uncharacterized protein LOC116350362 [Contarinia nasturtii]XP_031637998.1 uncharacterized protein LOC116350362 [Contarinia nasturtii]